MLVRAFDRFQKGSSAFREGRNKDAIEMFLEADRLVKNEAFAYNTAVAYEQMGDTANALAWYREYLRRALDAPDRERIAARIERLEQALARKGVQQVTVLAFPQGATVVLDGAPVGVTPWTAEIPPGEHQLQLRLPGYAVAKTRFDLDVHHARDVRVDLTLAPVALASDRAPSGGAQVASWTWASLGVGLAGLGAALGCELARGNAEDEAQSAPTQIEAGDAYRGMEDLRTAARVLLGIGAAATVAGGVMLVVDLTTSPDEAGPQQDDADVQAALGCRVGACGLGLSGHF